MGLTAAQTGATIPALAYGSGLDDSLVVAPHRGLRLRQRVADLATASHDAAPVQLSHLSSSVEGSTSADTSGAGFTIRLKLSPLKRYV